MSQRSKFYKGLNLYLRSTFNITNIMMNDISTDSLSVGIYDIVGSLGVEYISQKRLNRFMTQIVIKGDNNFEVMDLIERISDELDLGHFIPGFYTSVYVAPNFIEKDDNGQVVYACLLEVEEI